MEVRSLEIGESGLRSVRGVCWIGEGCLRSVRGVCAIGERVRVVNLRAFVEFGFCVFRL